ncbi:DUF6232 family protein [Kitasatospora sp. NPDC018058]|uniref:DUF6232 family protein n=1 Tax=Kitasatospora sp. NPDC018058 TaxID=3364025 RepID=UPI0037BE2E4D
MHGQALWVGGNMYPLRHIVHTQQTIWPAPRRSRTIGRFILQMLSLLLGTLVVLAGHFPDGAGALVAIVALIYLWQLVKRLRQKTLHKLAIEMSNAKTTVLTSHDRQTIESLVRMITDGINNPHAEFSFRAQNLHVGDKITQHGDHNTGKRVGL